MPFKVHIALGMFKLVSTKSSCVCLPLVLVLEFLQRSGLSVLVFRTVLFSNLTLFPFQVPGCLHEFILFACHLNIKVHALPIPVFVGTRLWIKPNTISVLSSFGIVTSSQDSSMQFRSTLTKKKKLIKIASADIQPDPEKQIGPLCRNGICLGTCRQIYSIAKLSAILLFVCLFVWGFLLCEWDSALFDSTKENIQ